MNIVETVLSISNLRWVAEIENYKIESMRVRYSKNIYTYCNTNFDVYIKIKDQYVCHTIKQNDTLEVIVNGLDKLMKNYIGVGFNTNYKDDTAVLYFTGFTEK